MTFVDADFYRDYVLQYGWIYHYLIESNSTHFYMYEYSSISIIPANITYLYFALNYQGNTDFIVIDNFFLDLREIVFAKGSSSTIRNITIDGVPELQSISFGKYSCRVSSNGRNDGWLTISNSPKLKIIEMHSYALQDYSSVVFSNLSSLQTISIGNYAFQQSLSFELQGIL